MTDRTVQFRKLMMHRVDERVRRGHGFELGALSPGVTIIHGPNGSGKSTTALVIQELLWPGRAGLERPSIEGWFQDGIDQWRVDIDSGHVECSREGKPGATPELGPPENRRRYRLALHELTQEDNAEFAAAIANASQGGYDLSAAAEALGFSEQPPSRHKQCSQLKESQQAIEEARRRQRDIDLAASDLQDLRKQRENAAAAERNIDVLQKAWDYHNAVEKCRLAELKLDVLPEGVASLHGDEREKLNQLIDRRGQLEKELAVEQERATRAEQELHELKLPDEGIDQNLLTQLSAWQRRLTDVESDLRQKRQQQSEAEAQDQKARQRLGEHLSDEQLSSVERVEIGELSVFARGSDQVRAQRRVVEERGRWLDQEEPEEVHGLEEQQIRDGITALSHWLASPTSTVKPSTRLWWPTTVATSLIAVLGLVLASVYHWTWITMVLAAAGVAVWDWWLRRSSAGVRTAGPRGVHQQSYETSGLPPPQDWSVSGVLELLRRLIRLAAIRAHEDERLRRLNDLRSEAESVDELERDLDERRKQLEGRLGLEISVANEWLPLLVDNIGLWQRSSDKAAGARHVLEGLEQEHQALLDEINMGLRPFDYNEVDSAETAAQSIEDLADRQFQRRNSVNEWTDARRRIKDTIEPALDDVIGQRRAIFERLGIDEDNESVVDEWLAERPDYLDLKKELAEAEIIREDRRQALADHEHLLESNTVNIQQEIEAQHTIAGKRDTLSEQIARIEHEIEAAKAGHELSDALAAVDAARDALVDARAENGAAVTGNLLTQWVRTSSLERSRPQVFHRANDLFVKFTHGTLHLNLDDHADLPVLQAQRASEPPRSADELSVGERVQLLMAVRLAFLEQDEVARLPLLLDEALATSDDGRAGIIIDSVIEIAREGRQVFYFTAQQDEVGKWVARLQSSGVPYKVIDLAQVRRLAVAEANPLEIASIEVPRPPAPDRMSYEEYGRALNVPGLDPTAEYLDGLHIWHLLDDADQLWRLLCQHIVTWGQLHTLAKSDGAGPLGVDERTLERVAAAAKAITVACQAWRIGRAKPVDRAALLDMDGVSEKFVDELTTLSKKKNGDAEMLLTALTAGAVKYWRSDNTDRLRVYLEENGFLPGEALFTPEQIRLRVMDAVAENLRADRIPLAFIDRIIGMLPP